MKQDTLESRAITKNGVKRLCFSGFCILLEAAFIIVMITRLNEYAEIINLITRLFAGILVLFLYSSDKTSSMKMPWIILILVFPIMGVSLYLLIGLNGGIRKMKQRYIDIDRNQQPAVYLFCGKSLLVFFVRYINAIPLTKCRCRQLDQ